MISKDILELGIQELSKEPAHAYEMVDNLLEVIKAGNKQKIIEELLLLDTYAYGFLGKEEYYAEISNFPKLTLLKSDIFYYRALFSRIRYHFTYYNIDKKEFLNILSYGIHLADSFKKWLDFHFETLDGELIRHLTNESAKLDS